MEVPTLREEGIDDVLYSWHGVWIPDGHRAELGALVDGKAGSAAREREAERRGSHRLHLRRADFAAFLEAEGRSAEGALRRFGSAG